MAFTEFWCDASANGSNLNGGGISTGGDPNAAPYPLTYVGGTWVYTTGVFTVASGNPSSDGVTVGDFASVYTAAATTTGFVGRVTARDTTTITVSLTAYSGTNPANGTYTVKVGGRWKGPNAADTFPFNFITAALTDSAGDTPRVNLTNGTAYNVTAAISSSSVCAFWGCASTPGDHGKFTLSGGTSSINLLTFSAGGFELCDFILTNSNGASYKTGLSSPTASSSIRRGIISNWSWSGFYDNSGYASGQVDELEVYNCGTVAGSAALNARYGGTHRRLIVHGCGYAGAPPIQQLYAPLTLIDCVIFGNVGGVSALYGIAAQNTDFYNNTGDAVVMANTTPQVYSFENCNFLKNTGYAFNGTGSGGRNGSITNCGFGTGSQQNNSGSGNTTGLKGMVIENEIDYASGATPWNSPTTGDFTIVLAAAKGTGRGTFTETQGSQSGTVAYPDIGAGQGSSVQPTPIIIAQTINRFIVPEGEEPNAT